MIQILRLLLLVFLLQPLLAAEPYPLHVYGSMGGLEKNPEQSVQLLAQYGYAGVVTGESNFQEYRGLGLPNQDLNVAAHYMRYDFAKEESDSRVRRNIDLLEGTDIDLWIIFKISDGVRIPRKEFIVFVQAVLPYAREKNVRIAIYPHIGMPNLFERAEQVIPIVNEINDPNLGLCLHLYHERYQPGQWHRLFQQAGDKVFAVTVTDWARDETTGEMEYAPLMDDGEDLLESYIKAIVASGYDGNIAWLNWKVDKMSPVDYLGPSMEAWQGLCEELALEKKTAGGGG